MAGSIQINPDNIHSAITTWSGFVYQGKIALYHSLKLLTEDTSAPTYLLQLDSLEDFAVMASATTYLSLHQIKALKNTYYSGYEEAFKKLCAKGTSIQCTNLNFHIAVQISDKTPTNIVAAHPGMKLYEYYDGLYYCPLKNVDIAIEHMIIGFYKKHSAADAWKQRPDYVTLTKNVLDDVIQRKVLYIHQQVHANAASDNALAFRETIAFIQLKAILEEDLSLRTTSDAYFQALLKGDLNRYYQEFCMSCTEPVSDELKMKMSAFIVFVNQLSDGDLLQFCRQIMPHRQVALTSFSQYKDTTFQQEDLKYAFFKALYELSPLTPNSLSEIGWTPTTGGLHIPTGISRPASEVNDVCEAIVENIKETDFDMPYETTMLITAYLDVPSLQEVINNTNDVSAEENEAEIPEEEKIMRWKKIGLCSIDEAKKLNL